MGPKLAIFGEEPGLHLVSRFFCHPRAGLLYIFSARTVRLWKKRIFERIHTADTAISSLGNLTSGEGLADNHIVY